MHSVGRGLALGTLLLASACSSLDPNGDFAGRDASVASDAAPITSDAAPVTSDLPGGASDLPGGASDVPGGASDAAPPVDVPPPPVDVPPPPVDVPPPPVDVPPPPVDVPPPPVDVPPPPVDVPTISLTDGLVVHHRFDGDGTDSAYGANGTNISVSFVSDRFGVSGHAARFTASSSGLSGSSLVIPSNSRLPIGAAPRTLAFWTIDRRNASAWQYRSMVGWGDIANATRFGVSGFANLGAHTDLPIFTGQSADVNATTGTNLVDARWHHLAVTYDGATLRLYVDGTLNNSGALTLNTTTRVLTIGRAVVRMSEFYDGDLDDLRIYNRALSSAEMSALFHDGGWM